MSLHKRLIIHFILIDLVTRVMDAILRHKKDKINNLTILNTYKDVEQEIDKELDKQVDMGGIYILVQIYKYYNLIAILDLIAKSI